MRSALDDAALARRLAERTGFHAAPGHGTDPVPLLAAALTPGPDAGAARTPVPRLVPPPPVMKDGSGKVDDAARKARNRTLAMQARQGGLWWLDRMVAAQHPWTEVRTWWWHNHWATSVRKVRRANLMLAQNQTLRRLGGGGFETLAKAMVKDPALMVWLDAAGNTKKAANENLARELMELFTLGVGHYSEADVRQAALALTGYRVTKDGRVRFRRGQHAEGEQAILGVRKAFDADSLVELLVRQKASPQFLATRMWGWLVSPNPPSAPSLERIVAAYGPTMDATEMFRAMLSDPAMRDPANALVKDPVTWLVGACRALGVTPSQVSNTRHPAGAAGARPSPVLRGLNQMGQVPFQPPSVGGWPSGAAWLNTAATNARLRLAQTLAGHADLAWLKSSGSTGPHAVNAIAGRLGVGAWTERTRSVLVGADTPRELVTLALGSAEFSISR